MKEKGISDKLNLKDKIIVFFLAVGTILLYLFFMKIYFGNQYVIGNTINGIRFGIIFIFIGFVIGIIFCYLLHNSENGIFRHRYLNQEYFSILVNLGFLIIPIIITTSIGYNLNYYLGEKGINKISVRVLDKEIDLISQTHKIQIESSEISKESVVVPKEYYDKLAIDDTLKLYIKNGKFGFKIIRYTEED